MPKTPKTKKGPVESTEPTIKQQVLEILGTPPKLRDVLVVKISDSTYRINIWATKDEVGEYAFMHSQTLAHSFFVKTDSTGKLIGSNPEIRKVY